jgi:phenylalanyl-tRNA synthetase beta chain
LLGSLLDVARGNRARGIDTIRLFETGAVYLPVGDGALPREPHHIGAVLIGPVRPATWRDPAPRAADFFAVKGVVGGLLGTLRAPWGVESGHEPFLHPGRAATLLVGGEPVGWVGEIHPLVAQSWELEQTVGAFELDLDAVAPHVVQTPLYDDLTSFPELREDLAVILSDTVTAARVLEVVKRAGAPLLQNAEVFDVYRDADRIGEGNVSLALRLSYRAADRTLTDEEVAAIRKAISIALSDQLQGRVRAS